MTLLLSPALEKVLLQARVEALFLGEDWVSTEHLLFALLRPESSRAIEVLEVLSLTPGQVLATVHRDPVSNRLLKPVNEVLRTPRGDRVLALAHQEAERLGAGVVDTQHLLLGLIAEGEGLAARVLGNVGIDLETARQACVRAFTPGPWATQNAPSTL